MMHNGLERTVFSITILARRLSRSSKTVRRWEQDGVIPPALRYGNRRVYLPEVVEAIVTIAKEEGITKGKPFRSTIFSSRVWHTVAALRAATRKKSK